ncbi:MAG: Rieske (2Fe-2S) protein [Myxococcales bacterium]|nr:Rieske (2Fe-2S) protein [Myxococcales bacterium]
MQRKPLPGASQEPADDSERIALTEADLAPGAHRGVKVGDDVYVLVTQWEGRYWAIDDSCNHAGCLLSEGCVNDGGHIVCPCHFAEFDVRTGALATSPRICEDQAAYEVEVSEGKVWVDRRRLVPV